MSNEDTFIDRLHTCVGVLIQSAIAGSEVAGNAQWDELYRLCNEIIEQTGDSSVLSKNLSSALFENYTGLADVVDLSEESQLRMHEFTLLVGEILAPPAGT
jgi:hypothetical protein